MDFRAALKVAVDAVHAVKSASPAAYTEARRLAEVAKRALRPEIDRAKLSLETWRLEQAVKGADNLAGTVIFFTDNYHAGKGAPELRALLRAVEDWKVRRPSLVDESAKSWSERNGYFRG